MKLRFDHQSIRLRVRKSDIEKLVQQGFILETVHFPSGMLTYRLETSSTVETVSTVIQNDAITVYLPIHTATEWIHSENVGLYATLPTSVDGSPLKVLVEKDFPCRHNSLEDNSDTFEELSRP